ncbi:Hypothetical predicted protein [Cloeon dipterum]|uniref:C-type lectin domain-containing protein n=1 Tax=Cloeon dipterum TaxID=197152 RepID=A0A8S1DTL3_9INSE|nr:Hypothetical predicted protein [Cloeon dipterum]
MSAKFFIPCLVTCLILHLGFSKRPSNNLERQRKQLQSKSSRQIIIKCCGKNSCLNQLSKKRSRQNSTISSMRETPYVKKDISSTRQQPTSLKKSSQYESTDIFSETDAGSSTTSSISTSQTEVSDKMENSTTVESVEAVVQTDPPDVAVVDNASPVTLIGPLALAYEHVCEKNLSLFDPDGHLLEAEDYGAWETTCGSLYLFGSKVLNWEENFNFCCSLGMLPLTVEDDWKRSCLQDFIGGS